MPPPILMEVNGVSCLRIDDGLNFYFILCLNWYFQCFECLVGERRSNIGGDYGFDGIFLGGAM